MHIVFFTDNYIPETNPSANRVSERARLWVQKGHRVTVITSFPNFPKGKVFDGYKNRFFGAREEIEGVEVVRVWTFIAPNKGRVFRVIDFLSYMFSAFFTFMFRIEKPDVVACTSPQFFCAVAAGVGSFLRRVPFVMEVSDLWPDAVAQLGVVKNRKLLAPFFWIERRLYAHASGIILLTEAYRRNLLARNVDDRKIAIIRNGADQRMVKDIPTDIELKNELGLNDKFVIGYAGTLGIAQNLMNAVEGMEKLERDGYNQVALLIIGAGAEAEALQAKIKTMSNVVFVDAIPRSEMSRYLSVCDVSLSHLKDSASNETVIPSKVFEAMGIGKPVMLVSPNGEGAQILKALEIGLHVPAGSPEKFALGALALANDPQALVGYRENCIKNASSHTRTIQAERYLEALNVAVSTRHRALLKTEPSGENLMAKTGDQLVLPPLDERTEV